MEYGRANTSGCPSEDEAMQILKAAVNLGVTHVDTARAYRDSERRIGLFLRRGYHQTIRVITKLDPLESLPSNAQSAVLIMLWTPAFYVPVGNLIFLI